jgi:hypothetical protein
MSTQITVAELETAAVVFSGRTDSFAAGKAEIAMDMAARLRRFGGFASAKQAEFAAKLVAWAQPKPVETPAPVVSSDVAMPRMAMAVLDFAKVTINHFTFTRNRDGARWILFNEQVIGRLEGETARLFPAKVARLGMKVETMVGALNEFEANPIKAITEQGKATGVCGCCGRTLTDEVSINAGIGPVCAKKLGIRI